MIGLSTESSPLPYKYVGDCLQDLAPPVSGYSWSKTLRTLEARSLMENGF
jgi:hypothetical protein